MTIWGFSVEELGEILNSNLGFSESSNLYREAGPNRLMVWNWIIILWPHSTDSRAMFPVQNHRWSGGGSLH